MPITFTNVIQDNVIKPLNNLISDEFSIPVRYDKHTGNQSFLLTPEADSIITHTTATQVREYEVNISYELKTGGSYSKNTIKQISNIIERLKRLIQNNSAHTSSGTYYWHDGNITNIEYEREEDDQTLLRSNATFNCIVQESY